MISQLTRHSQLVTIPQATLLTTANGGPHEQAQSVIHCLPSAYRSSSNATLRSTRSVPAIVYHQQQHAQQQHLIHQQQQQQLAYSQQHHHQNANNNFELDQCPVHGPNAISSLANHHHHHLNHAIHQNQLLPAQIANNRALIRKFASVNDLSGRSVNNLSRSTTAVNYLQTANNQLMPTVFTVANHHNLSAAMQAPIKAQQTIAAINAANNAQACEAKLAMTANILPLPVHPAVAPTIYTQPISIATSRPAPVLIPTFTTEPNSFAIAKHNKEQLINIVDANRDACCKGHLIVLWIILAVVIIGIVSGIILGLTV